ncbi:MAG: hypothetical protein LUD68_03445 [Rikenellaceae bacterium]|nr:hypothetical protein [Rikenellaceae bacterium]
MMRENMTIRNLSEGTIEIHIEGLIGSPDHRDTTRPERVASTYESLRY